MYKIYVGQKVKLVCGTADEAVDFLLTLSWSNSVIPEIDEAGADAAIALETLTESAHLLKSVAVVGALIPQRKLTKRYWSPPASQRIPAYTDPAAKAQAESLQVTEPVMPLNRLQAQAVRRAAVRAATDAASNPLSLRCQKCLRLKGIGPCRMCDDPVNRDD